MSHTACTRTVFGAKWFDSNVSQLNRIVIPAKIGQTKCHIKTEVVPADIPLLNESIIIFFFRVKLPVGSPSLMGVSDTHKQTRRDQCEAQGWDSTCQHYMQPEKCSLKQRENSQLRPSDEKYETRNKVHYKRVDCRVERTRE